MEAIVSYLLEIRRHLLRFLGVFTLVFIVSSFFSRSLFDGLVAPILSSLNHNQPLIAVRISSPIMVPILSAVCFSLYFCFPYAIFEVWRFVRTALYLRERRWARNALYLAGFLFYIGSAFAFWVVIPFMFHFIVATAPKSVAVHPDISYYFQFVCSMILSFGFVFELPIVVFMVSLFGLVSLETLSKARPVVFVGSFVVGMILTPPDALSQCMLAIPLYFLYELGLFLSRLAARVRAKNALEGQG